MAESENGGEVAGWSAPECPFTIEYSPRALDDIRLAVVEAFFSLPRGGAEIGGILCGNWDGQRLTITDYAALDCEHAFGPSFTLSPRDEARLADLMVASAGSGPRPVGWYHSHTRSEIFLTDADQDIHRRFFPEPWQVALVLRPHTLHPTRAGFFFRDSSGSIHGEASYAEFVLAPLAAKAATAENEPAGITVAEPRPPRRPTPWPNPAGIPERAAAPAPLPLIDRVNRSLWRRPWAAAALAVCGLLGAAAYWLPRGTSAPMAGMGLNTVDLGGQLQIRWDPNSQTVRRATGGILSIGAGGPFPQEISLDKAHLLSGVFTFARQTERVDVSLALTQPDGSAPREVTAFLGKLPGSEDPAVRDKLAKIQAELDAEVERNARLQKDLDRLSKEFHDQARGRALDKR